MTIDQMLEEVDHDLAQAETVLRRHATKTDILARDIVHGARRKLRSFTPTTVEARYAERYGIGFSP